MTTSEARHPEDRPRRPVLISVNRHRVRIEGPRASGLEIKEAAIEQGVPIDVSFQLALFNPDGTQQIIGDDDIVEVTNDSKFFATASDDNSDEGLSA